MDQLCMEQAVVKGLHLDGNWLFGFKKKCEFFFILWKIEDVWNGL